MDFISCMNRPEPIGSYRMCVGLGMYAPCPIYGVRNEYLPIPNKTMYQVRIFGFGGLYWINVEKGDIDI